MALTIASAVAVASPSAGWQFTNVAPVRDLAYYGGALFATGSAVSMDFNVGLPFTEMAVLRIDPATGAETWRYIQPDPGEYRAGLRLVTTPAGDVVAAESIFRVAKIDGLSGVGLWTYEPSVTGGIGELTVDASGDVVVSGTMINTVTSGYEFAVVKLSGATGSELWRYTAAGTGPTPFGGTDAAAVVVDSGGDVIAVGRMKNAGTNQDFAVVKLDGTTGAEVWRTEIDGGLSMDDLAGDVVLDDVGDVIASGRIETPTGTSATVKLAGASGTEIWRDAWPSGVIGAAVVERDSAGDLVVAVPSLGVAKLDPSTGTPVWSILAPFLGFKLTLTADDDPLVAFSDSGVQAFAQYRGTDGALRWRREVPATSGSFSSSIVADPSDRVYLAGRFVAVSIFGVGGGVGGRKAALRELAPGDLKVAVMSKDPLLFGPRLGGPNDPSVSGATFELRNPVTAETASIALPAAGWTGRTGKKPGVTVWKYGDAAGVCPRVRLISGKKLTIKCRGDLGFSLDEPFQGDLAATLEFAGGHRHCMLFGGVVFDEPGRFVAKSAFAVPCFD